MLHSTSRLSSLVSQFPPLLPYWSWPSILVLFLMPAIEFGFVHKGLLDAYPIDVCCSTKYLHFVDNKLKQTPNLCQCFVVKTEANCRLASIHDLHASWWQNFLQNPITESGGSEWIQLGPRCMCPRLWITLFGYCVIAQSAHCVSSCAVHHCTVHWLIVVYATRQKLS